MKSLVLVTSRFPYPPGEEFLKIEVDELARYFDKVKILPSNHVSGEQKQVPLNVEVLKPLYKGKALRTLQLLTDTQALSWLIKELLAASRHGVKAILKLINWTAITSELKRNIKNNRLIQLEGETVYYSYWLTPSAAALAMLKEANPNITAVSRVHGGDLYLERHSPPYLPYQEKVIQTLNQTYSISGNGKEYLSNLYPRLKDKISVSRLGIKNQNGYPKNKEKSSTLKIVSCSYLKPVKRMHLLAEALKHTRAKVEWTHIGDGPERERLEKLVKELPENMKVRFLGNLNNNEVYRHYQEHSYDLFINVSESEGIPVTIMEAFSFGIPVAATDVGGTSELVNKENGYLLAKDFSPNQLGKLLDEFSDLNQEGFQRKSFEAYKTWELHYNAEKNYQKFAELIKEVSSK